MSKPQLGKLESADNFNVVWENEPKEFTPWLAEYQLALRGTGTGA